MTVFDVAQDAALLPLVAVVVAGRSRAPRGARALAAAYAVSWVADVASVSLGDAWVASALWLPAQIALAFAAFVYRPLPRLALFVVFATAGIVTSIAWPGPGHDFGIAIVGSLVLLSVARGPLAPSVWAYFGLGTVAYMAMIVGLPALRSGDLTDWAVYQAMRGAAFALFAAAVLARGLGLGRYAWRT